MWDTTILDWLSFDPAPGKLTLDGTPTMVTTAVSLTYTVTDSATSPSHGILDLHGDGYARNV